MHHCYAATDTAQFLALSPAKPFFRRSSETAWQHVYSFVEQLVMMQTLQV